MIQYEQQSLQDLQKWEQEMQQGSSMGGMIAKGLQNRMNNLIPEKVHQALTKIFKTFTEAVLAGSGFVTAKPWENISLEKRDETALRRIKFYKNTAMAEGAVTGAGGFLLGLADLPLWLTLKMKMLFDIAAIYGYDTDKREERIFMLQVLLLGFSTKNYRKKIFAEMFAGPVVEDSEKTFDWRRFQQEYRDSIDLPKMLQLVPGIGAFVGASVNLRLTEKLGEIAMKAYHKRWFADREAHPLTLIPVA